MGNPQKLPKHKKKNIVENGTVSKFKSEKETKLLHVSLVDYVT